MNIAVLDENHMSFDENCMRYPWYEVGGKSEKTEIVRKKGVKNDIPPSLYLWKQSTW